MIVQLTGTIVQKRPDGCVLDVGGVGYLLAMSTVSVSALPAEGDTVTVHTHLQLREDGASLFGFESTEEKAFFEKLVSVNGVGPKVALAALSTLQPTALVEAVARGDAARIATTPGIGKKTAERIIVELKDKLDAPDMTGASAAMALDAFTEAQDALGAMGFGGTEVASALADFDKSDAAAEDLIKHALRRLGGAA